MALQVRCRGAEEKPDDRDQPEYDQKRTPAVMRQEQNDQQRRISEQKYTDASSHVSEIQRHPQPFPLRVLVDEQPGILPVDVEKVPAFHRHFPAFRPLAFPGLL